MIKKSVVLIDDHQLVRAGIRMLLESLGQYEVVGESSTGIDGLNIIRETKPCLVLLDLSLPDISGLDVLAKILHEHEVNSNPPPLILILSMHADKEYVRRALSMGAAGYIVKDAATDELELALHQILAGNTWASPSLKEPDLLLGTSVATGKLPLSKREIEVLKLIAIGSCTKEIAADLSISVKTVETYRMQLMDKLSVRNIPGLVRYAVKTGLITL
jgi:DNA-binding NarL/FixJ family response regulator